MKIKNIMLFSYDFPHKKTLDFIVRLLVENFVIKYVIAAPWEKLNIPKSTIRTAPSHVGLVHPKIICKSFGIPYIVSAHNSLKTVDYLTKHPVDIYIISGARVLPKRVITVSHSKILNIHPGWLPYVRGLDTHLWSIYNDKPLGISAHFISPKVDSGLLIYREKLELKTDDTIIDISLRLLEKQTDILITSINILKKRSMSELRNLDLSKHPYSTKMSTSMERETLKKFKPWLKKHSTH